MVVGLMRHIRNFLLISSHEKVQGPNSQPGYRHILTLAKALVEVWSLQGLPDSRVDKLITLWLRLPEGDKQRVVYPARHQERQTKGRSKADKRKNTSWEGESPMQVHRATEEVGRAVLEHRPCSSHRQRAHTCCNRAVLGSGGTRTRDSPS